MRDDFFSAKDGCRHCLDSKGMREVKLSRRGVVYASALISVDSPAGIKAPYAFGYVDIPADGIRVFALFKGTDPALIAPGQEVELVIEPVATSHGQTPVVGYKYKPVRRRIL